jgi:hypothetical protein
MKAFKGPQVDIYDVHGRLCTYVDPVKLANATEKPIELDMDILPSQEALDAERAFYKDETM